MKKFLALTLAAVTALSLFAGCAKNGGSQTDPNEIVLPYQDVAETPENRQAAMVETAKAYYRKNSCMQYDWESLTIIGRRLGCRNAADMNNTPEMATPQRNVYHVCSYLTYAAAYHAFDLKLNEGWANCQARLIAMPVDDATKELIHWHHHNAPTRENNLSAMEEFRTTLQPGDIIAYTRYHGVDHAGLWVGDITGDGLGDILNVDGKMYDDVNKTEYRETTDVVELNTDNFYCPSGEYFYFEPTAYDYYPKLEYVSILRPADMKFAEKYPITERAKTRILFPGLTIWYEVENGIYGAIPKGETLTYTLRIQNESEQNHEGILVQLPVPKNAEILSVNGTAVKNKTIKMNVNIPAGQEITIAYDVLATGEVGSVIQSGVGYVHAIPLPNLNTTVTDGAVDAAKVKAAMEAAKDKTGEAFLVAYLTAMGYDGDLIPTFSKLQSALYGKMSFGEYRLLTVKPEEEVKDEYKTLYKIQIPDFFGGQTVATDVDSLRVKELLARDLQAGDILIWKQDSVSDVAVAVHDGEHLMMAEGGKLTELTQWKLDEFIMYDYFNAFRPANAKTQ